MVMVFAQNYLWACYGFCISSLGIARLNSMSALICLTSFGIVAKCVQPRELVQQIMLMAVLMIVVFSIGVTTISYDASRIFAYSATLASVGAIIVSSGEFVRAMQHRSWDQLSITMIVANFIQSFLSAKYSVLIHDSFYLFPNAIGTMVFGAQLLVVYWLGGVSKSVVLVSKGENEEAPLMPRKRGKSSMSNCNSFLSLFSGRQACYGAADSRKDCEFGLPTHCAFADDISNQTFASRNLDAWPSGERGRTCADIAASQVVKKSPFSPFDEDEHMDNASKSSWVQQYKSTQEAELEPQYSEDMADQENAISNGEDRSEYHRFGSSQGIDCIL
jgi:hypothetical protein